MDIVEEILNGIPNYKKSAIALRLSISCKIDDIRNERGLSMDQFAKLTTIDIKQLEVFRSGFHDFTISELCFLSKKLNVNLFVLMGLNYYK